MLAIKGHEARIFALTRAPGRWLGQLTGPSGRPGTRGFGLGEGTERQARSARRLLIDLIRVYRSRDRRCLILGELMSVLGTQPTTVAMPYKVYQPTRSSSEVGAGVPDRHQRHGVRHAACAVPGAGHDPVRGRRVGDLEAGAVTASFGDTVSVVSRGMACSPGALLLARPLPGFRHQRTPGAHMARAARATDSTHPNGSC